MPQLDPAANRSWYKTKSIAVIEDGSWFQFQFQFVVYSQPIRIEAVREQDPI